MASTRKTKQLELLVPDLPAPAKLSKYLEVSHRAKKYSNFGPVNAQLEHRLAEFLGVPDGCVATVANCTLGLELCLEAVADSALRRVSVPGLTFPATATAATRFLRSPVDLVVSEVLERQWSMDFGCLKYSDPDLRNAWSPQMIAVPVCPFGAGLDSKYLKQLVDMGRGSLRVVVDAAAAFGNMTPRPSVPTVFSMHATKALPAGEGGFVVAERELVREVALRSNFGLDNGVTVEGWSSNGKLSEYHAAVAMASLDRWQETSDARRNVAWWYRSLLKEYVPSVELQQRPETDVLTTMPVMVPRGVDPDRVSKDLSEGGVPTRRYYCPPVHQHPAWLGAVIDATGPVTKDVSGRLLCLPFHTGLSHDDVRFVCQQLSIALRYGRRASRG